MRVHFNPDKLAPKLSQTQFDDDFVDLQELREALERAWGEYKQASTPEAKREKLTHYRSLLKQFTAEAFRRPWWLNVQLRRGDFVK
jgi:hypothetical protein